MHTLKMVPSHGRRGVGALVAGLIAFAVLLVGAAGAQAKPSEPPRDFLFEVQAESVSFTPIEGKPGFYALVLHGVPDKVRVDVLPSGSSRSDFDGVPLSTKHLMVYWMGYGDETGQFESNAPRAVLRPVDGSGDEVAVRLRDGSRKGSTLRFEAEVITSPRVWNVLEQKIDEAEETTSEAEPRRAAAISARIGQVEVFIDMPNRITQPEAPVDAAGDAAAKSILRIAAPVLRNLTCNNVYSSRLVKCWNDIQEYAFREDGPSPVRPFIAFNQVGLVDLGDYWFRKAYVAEPGWDSSRGFRYWSEGQYYGVNPQAETLFTTSRCTWFMAKWAANGRCW